MSNFKRTTTRLMIVAGRDTEELATTFAQRIGSPSDIRYKTATLADKYEYYSSTKISVDKLVFYIQEDTHIKRETTALLRLMGKEEKGKWTLNPLFKVGQIFFFTKEDEYSMTAVEEFKSVMEALNYTSVTYTRNPALSFSDIVTTTIDAISGDKPKNSRRVIYSTRAGSSSKDIYDMDDTFNKVMEPFNFDRVNSYDQTKAMSQNIGLEYPIIEDDENNGEGFEDNLTLTRIGESVVESDEGFSYIVTGTPKSGTSVLATTLANSLVFGGNTTLLFDLTDTQGSCDYVDNLPIMGFNYQIIDIKDIISTDLARLNGLDLIVVKLRDLGYGDRNKLITLNFVLSKLKSLDARKVVVDCDLKNYEDILTILRGKIRTCLCTTSMREGELRFVADALDKTDNNKVKVLQVSGIYNDILGLNLSGLQAGNILGRYAYNTSYTYNPLQPDAELFKDLTGEQL